jgi:hypothetical protein
MKRNVIAVMLCLALGCATTARAEQVCEPGAKPASEFVDHGDGTVTHTRSGLMWKRCAEGQAWRGGTCEGKATGLTWTQAVKAAHDAHDAGHRDWRVPNIGELMSIVEPRCNQPSINEAVFPATPSADFWSASTSANKAHYAWYVFFSNGYAQSHDKKEAHQVRLVRSGK